MVIRHRSAVYATSDRCSCLIAVLDIRAAEMMIEDCFMHEVNASLLWYH